ncbi:inorganic phosphate transporter [Shigella flexneri]
MAFVLFYEAINGFHDAANTVATVIYTRAMRSQLAVVMAAVFNLGVLLGGLSVAYALCICCRRIYCLISDGFMALPWCSLCCWRRFCEAWVAGTLVYLHPAHTLIGAMVGLV